MTEGEILYSINNQRCIFKLTGSLRHTNSTGFNATIRKLFEESQIASVIIDLRETAYIDSTNLGLLGIISRNLWRINKTRPSILCPKNDVYTILISMDFQNYFTLISDAFPKIEELSKIPDGEKPTQEKTILEAHETLLEMSECNRIQFENLVDLLREELGREDAV